MRHADVRSGGWDYTLARSRPVLAAPMSFKPLARNWWPPGDVIPDG